MTSHPVPAPSRRPLRTSPGRFLAALLGGALVWLATGTTSAAPRSDAPWRTEITIDGSVPDARHEAAGVAVEGHLWLLGGRGAARRVDVYDPVAGTWSDVGPMPLELHHFQAVAIGAEIWIVGALTGPYSNETAVAEIHVFDTESRTWRVAGTVPKSRRRGSAGVALHDDGLVYVLGGNTLGHAGGAVPWFDRFDPVTGVWERLPDAPRPRDHFGIAIVDGRLVAAGGRATALPDPFANTIGPIGVYDLELGRWSIGADLPTRRAGAFTVGHGAEVVLAGGENTNTAAGLDTVESYDVRTNAWRTLRPLSVGRHSGGAATLDGRLHAVSGSPVRGGGQSSAHESLELGDDVVPVPVSVDTDGDGLSDADEIELGTAPTVADTDGDTLDDGVEVRLGTDPLITDTDADGLSDADEHERHGSDPLGTDTDGDGIHDGEEVRAGTDPLVDERASRGTRPVGSGSGGGGVFGIALVWLGMSIARRRRERLPPGPRAPRKGPPSVR